MTILDIVSSSTAGRLAVTTLLFGAVGFVSGFLLALVVAAHSLYSCTAIL
jgi:hypothetical protein